jgi:hypothetical protein
MPLGITGSNGCPSFSFFIPKYSGFIILSFDILKSSLFTSIGKNFNY